MKTKFISSVMAIVLTSASLFAADPAATVELLNQKGSSVYKVVYKAPGNGSALLKISNKDGLVLSERFTFTNGFTLPVDFKGMANGEYTVEVLSKGFQFKQTVAYSNVMPVAYVRVTEQPGQKKLLTITSPKTADFIIRVFDSANNELFSTTETITNGYASLFNTAKVSGDCHIEVTAQAGNVAVVRK
jgi:hypothetical protein